MIDFSKTAQLAIAVAVLSVSARCAVAGERAMIRLKSRVQVTGSVITLGDVADINGIDIATRRSLQRIRIGAAPSARETVRVSFSSVRSHLRDYGVDLSRLGFTGASVISVTARRIDQKIRLTSGVAGRRIDRSAQRAEEAVAKAIQQYLGRVVPELGRVAVTTRIPASKVADVLTAIGTGYEVRGGRPPWSESQVFRVRFLDARERLHEIQVRASIERQPHVLAARVAIPSGTLIQADHLIWKQVKGIKPGNYTNL